MIWYTKAGKRQLYFSENLEIQSGTAEVPAMLWLATQRSLKIFALSSNRRPTEKTSLFYAPFFNVYENGNVCMGTVNIDIQNSASVEEFMEKWEDYFYEKLMTTLSTSYFFLPKDEKLSLMIAGYPKQIELKKEFLCRSYAKFLYDTGYTETAKQVIHESGLEA